MSLLQRQVRQTLKELALRAAPRKSSYALVMLFSLIAASAGVFQPLLFKDAINDVTGVQVKVSLDEAKTAQDGSSAKHVWMPHRRERVSPRTRQEALQTLYRVLLFLLLLSCLSIFFNNLADNLSAKLGYELEKGLVQSSFSHALKLPLNRHELQTSGELAKKVEQVDQVSPIVEIFTRTLGPEIIRLFGIVAVMLYHSPFLTLITLLPLPLYFFFSSRLSRLLDHNVDAYFGRWQALTGRIVEVFAGIKTVKQSGAQDREAARLDRESNSAYALALERERINNRFLAWENLFIQLSRILVLCLGGWMVFQARLTPGIIVMFVAYIDQLYAPLSNLSSVNISLREHAASTGRALTLLRLPEAASGSRVVEARGAGSMVFKRVKFGYQKGRPVLHGLDFQLKPGTVTALVGPSGSGKTTVVDLLTGLQHPWSGDIQLNGIPLKELREQELRRDIAAVSADGAIFSGSLAWNIRYQRPDITDKAVLAAARAAGLQSLIRRLPKGLKAHVGPGGHGLSVGERQRLQLARVLAAKPSVLLLDEATANLDFANEMLVKQALRRLKGQCTLLVVAHRWSMVSWADQVLVMRAGRLVQKGSPARLAARSGWLRRMAQSASRTRS